MKKKEIILTIFFLGIIIRSSAQTDPTLQKLLQINYTAYVGHTVDSLVKALPKNYTEMKILPSHRGDYGDVLAVSYANDVYIWIQVKQFKYMNPLLNKTNTNLSPTVNWKVNLFEKETMAFAIVYQGATCWAGCQYDPKSTAP